MRKNPFDFLLASRAETSGALDCSGKEESLEEDYFELSITFKKPPVENYARVSTGHKVCLESLPLYRTCLSPSLQQGLGVRRPAGQQPQEPLQTRFAGSPAALRHSEQAPAQSAPLSRRDTAVHSRVDGCREPRPERPLETAGAADRRISRERIKPLLALDSNRPFERCVVRLHDYQRRGLRLGAVDGPAADDDSHGGSVAGEAPAASARVRRAASAVPAPAGLAAGGRAAGGSAACDFQRGDGPAPLVPRSNLLGRPHSLQAGRQERLARALLPPADHLYHHDHHHGLETELRRARPQACRGRSG